LTAVPDSGTPQAQRVALSAVALIGARAIQFVLSMAITVALVRYLGPGDYGDYIFVVSLTGVLVLFCDFGLMKVAVGEITREPAAEPAIVGTVMLARLGIAVLIALGVQLFLAAVGARETVRIGVAIASAWFASEALLTTLVLFQVRIAMQFEALTSLISNLIQVIGAVWLIRHGGTVNQIVVLPALGGFVAAAVAAGIVRARYQATLRVDLHRLPQLLLAAVPIGITVAIAVVSLKLGGVLLGVMATPEDVGLYGAASKLIEYLVVGAAIMLNPAYPLLVRWYIGDHARFRMLYERIATAILVLMLPIPITLAFTAGWLVALLYPPEFANAAAAFQILSAALALLVLNAWHGFVLLAARRQQLTMGYDAAALMTNVVLNLVLIPRLGYLGAAWGALGAASIAAVCAIFAVARVGAHFEQTPLARVGGALLIFTAALWGLLTAGLPVITALGVASLTYGLALQILQIVDVKSLRGLLPGGPTVASRLPEPKLL
jgi:O-antigen/teichoic acid export membrane protein